MFSNQWPLLPPKETRRDKSNFNKSKPKKRNNKDTSQNKTKNKINCNRLSIKMWQADPKVSLNDSHLLCSSLCKSLTLECGGTYDLFLTN